MMLKKDETNLKILDIGCGNAPRGDVNIDLFIKNTEHRNYTGVIKTKKIPHFIIADALNLPIREKSFDHIVSSHVIEHLDRPIQFLRECIRVARKSIKIKCPHRYALRQSYYRKIGAHQNSLSVKWFGLVLKQFNYDIRVVTRGFPHEIFSLLNWVSEIEITIFLSRIGETEYILWGRSVNS